MRAVGGRVVRICVCLMALRDYNFGVMIWVGSGVITCVAVKELHVSYHIQWLYRNIRGSSYYSNLDSVS